MKIYEGNALLGEVIRFENFDNLSKGYFKLTDSDFLEVESDKEYSIVIKGIKNIDYVSNEEEYNDKTKIQISSCNSETSLVCLAIE